LPREQRTNLFVERECRFRYFFVRKLMFLRQSCAFPIFTGGFSTLDEAFEALTLVQTHEIPHFPVLLFAGGFGSNLLEQLDLMMQRGAIPADDRAPIRVVSTADEAVEIPQSCHEGLCASLREPPLHRRGR
jgi:predicted Rossmann-fold nucleotide-binding protein